MNLQFLGIGSDFETKLYNTSAFLVDSDKLFLIDCGTTTMAQIESLHLLNYVKEVYVAFTHTHSDHIAGIGHLANSCNFILGKRLNIIVPKINKFFMHKKIKELLDIFSIPCNYYTFLDEDELYNKFSIFSSLTFIPTTHCPQLQGNCFSILFDTPDGIVFYSGDSYDTNNINDLLKYDFDKMYIDVTLSIKNVHLDLNLLKNIIPKEQREKIFCMHFDSSECMYMAKSFGFSIANCIASNIDNIPLTFKYNLDKNNNFILSNCGELTFMQLKQNDIFDIICKANNIYLTLENTKYENVASLGSLLCYLYFVLNKCLKICTTSNNVKNNVVKLLEIYGVPKNSVSFIHTV